MYKRFLLIGTAAFVEQLKPTISGLALEIEIANTCTEAFIKLKKRGIDVVIIDQDSYLASSVKKISSAAQNTKLPFVIFSKKKNKSAFLRAKKLGAADFIIKPYNARELNLRLSAILNKKQIIACIGGGTGLFNLLMGIKELPGVLPVSIVSTSDDGGSSGRLKNSFGILPPGDIRRSLVALSNAPEIMNRIIQYRFVKGSGFKGHNFGNILLTVLNELKGSMSDAVRGLGDILNINGIVYPVAKTKSTLYALFENGKIVKGESSIDLCKGRAPELAIKKVWHAPEPQCDINAYTAIMSADIVTIGPGDLFTSVITNLLIKDIREALINTKAKVVYICNLMTEPGETFGLDAYGHIKQVIKYLKKDCLDYVIISDTRKLSKGSVARYARKQQYPVELADLRKIKKLTRAKIIIADLAHETELVRHDSSKIKEQIAKISKEVK